MKQRRIYIRLVFTFPKHAAKDRHPIEKFDLQ